MARYSTLAAYDGLFDERVTSRHPPSTIFVGLASRTMTQQQKYDAKSNDQRVWKSLHFENALGAQGDLYLNLIWTRID